MIFKKPNNHTAANTLKIRNEKDFESIYSEYATQMLSLAYNHTYDIELAKEIVQDIFLSIWERRKNLSIKGPIKNYLLRAVKLEVIDHYRQKARDEKHLTCAFEEYCTAPESTEETVLYNELSNQISYLVDRLPCQCREVYILSRKKGLKNKEIAKTLLISEKTVESHLTKALKFIRHKISTS
ncbi:RNA polymerase sigma-70 factor [Echinicola sp. 20G]|uniref:RNA polymerase sigma-70 factor n=1 Tax=Echinicola sp. 20G TaxID=2781961 RepID=UPI001F3EFCEE|nr:RNA polymerase sigma-70 factor [Echinicola sp. 20G]